MRNICHLMIAGLAVLASAPALAQDPPDAAKGQKLFANQCGTCHAFDPAVKKAGPHLQGLIGRAAGTVEGFRYSAGFRETGIVWDADTLSTFLKNPKAMIPGTVKVVRVNNDAQRADLIAYLVQAGTASE